MHDALAATGYDLYGNLNTYAFDVNADAVATAIVTFAHDTSTVNGDAGAASVKVSAEAAGTGSLDIHGHARRLQAARRGRHHSEGRAVTRPALRD